MTNPRRMTALRISLLLVIVAVLGTGPDLAWACDPDPSDWEAGLEACREWQRGMDGVAWRWWLGSAVPLAAIASVGLVIVRRQHRLRRP